MTEPEISLDYDIRLRAVTDGLHLVRDSTSRFDPNGLNTGSATTLRTTRSLDPYAEVSLALDIARFLLDQELPNDDEGDS